MKDNRLVWIIAGIVAGLATWLMYDAEPGVNWAIWTAAAAAGMLLFLRKPGDNGPIVMGTVAAVIAGGAVVTANELFYGLICLSVILFLALEMLLSTSLRLGAITFGFTVSAPVVAFGIAVVESVRRALDALHLVRSDRARAVVRGIAITVPVVAIFALLLSSADPLFAQWRDTIEEILENLEFLPRTVFFFATLTIVLGAYGFAAKGEPLEGRLVPGETESQPNRWLGSTERLILLASVAALFWIFLLVQLTYLFGNLPLVTGSGMTFAEYARRGFGELTFVASASAALILLSERYGRADDREGLLRAVTIALMVAVLFLLASAFRRVWLYEEAYGFTTSRLYAQAYMIVVATALVALFVEVRGEIQPSRLFRRVFAVATLAFIVLIYWNHEAWIADRNIDRYAQSGKLDTVYLTRDLSPNAVPTVIARIPTLPEPARTELGNAVRLRYTGRHQLLDDRWYVWNRGRAAARDALLGFGVDLKRQPPAPAPVPPPTRVP
ncbi:MAG: DUF4173 domain-containing protein [Gemmatimonadales bacterium]